MKAQQVVAIRKRTTKTKMVAQHKWAKFRVLKEMNELEPFLPATQKFRKRVLWDFIDKYGKVMLKPYLGHSGRGVIQVSRLEENRFAIHIENKKIIVDGKRSVSDQLEKLTNARRYIVQRRISLAEINKRPFDIRVMVKRKKQSPWKVTGMFAKVAERDYVVSNVSGTLLPVEAAIEQSLMKPVPTQKLLKRIKKVCLTASKQLGNVYAAQNIIGFDIGLDHDANVWIIEANFKPSLRPLILLKGT